MLRWIFFFEEKLIWQIIEPIHVFYLLHHDLNHLQNTFKRDFNCSICSYFAVDVSLSNSQWIGYV